MKIIREILGQNIEIELTANEMRDAYLAVQHGEDIDVIADFLEDNGYNIDNIPDIFLHKFANELRDLEGKGYGEECACERVREMHCGMLSHYKED
jgi:hypothetical protein